MELSFGSKKLFTALLIISLLTVSCAERAGRPVEKESARCVKPSGDLNPNGSSELSQLMRKMQAWTDSAKQLIVTGGVPKPFSQTFKKIFSAEPTDAETKKPSFAAFAQYYLHRLDLLERSAKDSLRENYNATVDACISCHGDHCPGPIKSIRKLKL